jgi:hypothetical protein
LSPRQGPGSPGKRGQLSKDSRSAKKLKIFHGIPTESSKVIGLPKIKSENSVPTFDPLQNEQVPVLRNNSLSGEIFGKIFQKKSSKNWRRRLLVSFPSA